MAIKKQCSKTITMAMLALVIGGLALPSQQAEASLPPPGTLQEAAVDQHQRPMPLLNGRSVNAPVLLADASNLKGRVQQFFQRKPNHPEVITPDQAAGLIKGGDRVFVAVGQPSPNMLLKKVSENAKKPGSTITPENPVSVVGLCHSVSRSIFDREGRIVHRSLFLGGNARDAIYQEQGNNCFVPVYFHRVPRNIREGLIPVDVAMLQVSKPDSRGFVSLGPTAGSSLAAMEMAKTVIGQVNKEIPRTYGDTMIHISQLNYLVKANEALPEIQAAKITPIDRKIAKNVTDLILERNKKPEAVKPGRKTEVLQWAKNLTRKIIPSTKYDERDDLLTFQFGIGGIPDATAAALAKAPELEACRVYSELIGKGTEELVRSGKVKHKVKFTFAMGDKKFLKWMDKNRKLKAVAVDELNLPANIGKNNRMVAINSAVEVDLNGQVNSQRINDRWYSGVGGQVDFMRGAMESKGGKAIIALPSTAMVSDGQGGKQMVSKIKFKLGEDAVVTTNMHDLQYVVTEHGIASLECKSDMERQAALISVADPRFRPQLQQQVDEYWAKQGKEEKQRYIKFKEERAIAAQLASQQQVDPNPPQVATK